MVGSEVSKCRVSFFVRIFELLLFFVLADLFFEIFGDDGELLEIFVFFIEWVLGGFVEIMGKSELSLILQMNNLHAEGLVALMEIVDKCGNIVKVLEELFDNEENESKLFFVVSFGNLYLQHLLNLINLSSESLHLQLEFLLCVLYKWLWERDSRKLTVLQKISEGIEEICYVLLLILLLRNQLIHRLLNVPNLLRSLFKSQRRLLDCLPSFLDAVEELSLTLHNWSNFLLLPLNLWVYIRQLIQKKLW